MFGAPTFDEHHISVAQCAPQEVGCTANIVSDGVYIARVHPRCLCTSTKRGQTILSDQEKNTRGNATDLLPDRSIEGTSLTLWFEYFAHNYELACPCY